MAFYITIILLLISLLCIYYIFDTRYYYIYCTYAKQNNDYIVKEVDNQLYMILCDGVFKDYSDHLIMKYSSELLYTIFTNVKEPDKDSINTFLNSKSYLTMNFEMQTLKKVHFVFYLLLLYLLVIYLPQIFIKVFHYLLDRLLYVIFIILICEAVLNIFLDFNVDVMKSVQLIYNFLPFKYVGGLIIKQLF